MMLIFGAWTEFNATSSFSFLYHLTFILVPILVILINRKHINSGRVYGGQYRNGVVLDDTGTGMILPSPKKPNKIRLSTEDCLGGKPLRSGYKPYS